jgi:hypothetical protein
VLKEPRYEVLTRLCKQVGQELAGAAAWDIDWIWRLCYSLDVSIVQQEAREIFRGAVMH